MTLASQLLSSLIRTPKADTALGAAPAYQRKASQAMGSAPRQTQSGSDDARRQRLGQFALQFLH